MKQKAWLVIICLIAAVTVLPACGGGTATTATTTSPATTKPVATTTSPATTKPVGTTTSPAATKPVATTTAPATTTTSDKPQYGGVAFVSSVYDILYWDDTVNANVYCWSLRFTNDELLQGDWARGPAGTGEVEWTLAGSNRLDQKAGALADSWEIPQQGTLVFHIRKGVRWASSQTEAGRLVNGRELTVDDVVFSINRAMTTKGAYFTLAYPGMAKSAVVTGDTTARTVTVTCPLAEWVNLITLVPDFMAIVPPEVVNKYGNMQDWRNSVGTGPFILTDFISNSSATFSRNPNYWMTNPCGPGKGDQLPYVDKVNYLIIPDDATSLSAFRVGKLDSLAGRTISQVGTLINDPTLKVLQKRFMTDGSYVLGMRTDMAESPFSKKDVRQAVMLALNLAAVKDQYFLGDAELEVWPIAPPPKEYKDVYMSLDQLPPNVQALYKGPDLAAAKALLAKAGLPNGFKASVICGPYAIHTDVMSMFKSDLAKVGIDLAIDSKDVATWTARFSARNYGANELMYVGVSGIGTYQKMINMRGSSIYNPSYINDPEVEKAYTEMQKYVGIDEAKCMQISRNLMPYLLEQCYVIPLPSAYLYTMWWPWVKNYNGEYCVGYYNYWLTQKYASRDVTLKKKMIGQ